MTWQPQHYLGDDTRCISLHKSAMFNSTVRIQKCHFKTSKNTQSSIVWFYVFILVHPNTFTEVDSLLTLLFQGHSTNG